MLYTGLALKSIWKLQLVQNEVRQVVLCIFDRQHITLLLYDTGLFEGSPSHTISQNGYAMDSIVLRPHLMGPRQEAFSAVVPILWYLLPTDGDCRPEDPGGSKLMKWLIAYHSSLYYSLFLF